MPARPVRVPQELEPVPGLAQRIQLQARVPEQVLREPQVLLVPREREQQLQEQAPSGWREREQGLQVPERIQSQAREPAPVQRLLELQAS